LHVAGAVALPNDTWFCRLAADSYALNPEGEVYDFGADRAVLDRHSTYVTITIRGSANRQNWWSNFQIEKKVMVDHPEYGPCEAGFLTAAMLAFATLEPVLDRAVPIVVNGHSRGAGITPPLVLMLLDAGYTVIWCILWECPWTVGAKARARIQDAGVPGRQYRDGNSPVTFAPALFWLVAWVWPVVHIGAPTFDPIDCHLMHKIWTDMVAIAAATETPAPVIVIANPTGATA
jgi:hypothetical protein